MIREYYYKTADQAVMAIAAQAQKDINFIRRRFPFRGDLNQAFKMLKKQLTYTEDPAQVELIQRPRTLLSKLNELGGPGYGDCDDFTTLAISYALAHNIPAFIVLAGNGPQPGHVYAVLYDENEERWRKFDLTAPVIDVTNKYNHLYKVLVK